LSDNPLLRTRTVPLIVHYAAPNRESANLQ
jgi:hypothetical protein